MQKYSNERKVYETRKCNYGFECKVLIEKGRCRSQHDEGDVGKSRLLKRLTQNKISTLVVVGLADPFYLIEGKFNIKIGLNGMETEKNHYYKVQFVECKNLRITLNVLQKLGSIESNKQLIEFMKNHRPQVYHLEPGEGNKKNIIRIQGSGVKFIRQYQQKYYFSKVNQVGDYPLLYECTVDYTINPKNHKKAFIHKITYPKLKLSGILKINEYQEVTFVPRDDKIDHMYPVSIPIPIIKTIGLKQLEQYSVLYPSIQNFGLSKKKINEGLKKYLIKGSLKSWPLSSFCPIIQLQDEATEMNLQNIKEAIIFQKQIEGKRFLPNQKKEAQKIISQFQKEKVKYKESQNCVFTIDSPGTRSRDDAISINLISENVFQIGIHITDVDYFIQKDSYLDEQASLRDSTVYIRNYHFPMLPDALSNDLLSLKANQAKYTVSIFFKMTRDGWIDFHSVQFVKTTSKIQQNLTYYQADELLKKEQNNKIKKVNNKIVESMILFQKILRQRKLIDENQCLQTGLQSQRIISQLMTLNSSITTFIIHKNLAKVQSFLKSIKQYIEVSIQQKFDEFKTIENEIKKLDLINKTIKKIKDQKKKITKQFDKRLKNQQQRIKKQIKHHKKLNENLQKKQRKKLQQQVHHQKKTKKTKKKTDQQVDESETGSLSSEQEQQTKEQRQQQDQEINSQKEEDIEQILTDAARQVKEEQIKKPKTIQKKQQSDSSEDSEDSNDQNFKLNIKQSSAKWGKLYLQRIFQYFNISITWLSTKQISAAFQKIINLNKNKLSKMYFQRMQIMNKQHYTFIVKKEKELLKAPKRQKRQSKKDQEKYIHTENRKGTIEVILQEKQQVKQNQYKIETKQLEIGKQQIIKQAKKKRQTKKGVEMKHNNAFQGKNQKKHKLLSKPSQKQKSFKKKKRDLPNIIKVKVLKDQIETLLEKYIIKKAEKNEIVQKKKNDKKQVNLIKVETSKYQNQTLQQKQILKEESKNQILQKKKNDKKQVNLTKVPVFKDQMEVLLKNYIVQQEKPILLSDKQLLKVKLEEARKILLQRYQLQISELNKQLEEKQEQISGIKNILTQFIENWSNLTLIIKRSKKPKQYTKLQQTIFKILTKIQASIKYKAPANEIQKCITFLRERFQLQNFKIQQIAKMNEQMSEYCSDSSRNLKWNNPIRSYSSLQTLRLVKKYRWLLQGNLHPFDIIDYADDIEQIKKDLKQIKKYQQKREEVGQLSKNAKEANREIAKWQLYERIKNDPKRIQTFLNILAPPNSGIKCVFHPILEDLNVRNRNFQQTYFQEVKGTFFVQSEFPLELSVQLEPMKK